MLAAAAAAGALGLVGVPVQWLTHRAALDAEAAAQAALQTLPLVQAQSPSWGTDLPMPAAAAQLLAELGAAGQRERLRVGEVVARPTALAGGALQRHEISLTLSGPFAEARALVADLLARYPSLALDAITVSRATPEAPLVETQLRLSLYTRP